MGKHRFREHPLPDSEVVELLEGLLAGAKLGQVRSLAVVMVNPLQQVEVALAGDLGPIRANALLGGMSRAASTLTSKF